MSLEIVETVWYKFGKLKTDLSLNGVMIRAGESAVVSVDVWNDKTIFISVNSGNKNIFLPYQTNYESWF